MGGVTTIVVPDEPELPLTRRRSAAYAVGLFTAAMGRPPVYDHSAWVWSAVAAQVPPDAINQTGFNACVTGAASRVSSRRAVPLASPDRRMMIIRVNEEGGRRCRSRFAQPPLFKAASCGSTLGARKVPAAWVVWTPSANRIAFPSIFAV